MERAEQYVPLANRDRVIPNPRQDLDVGAVLLDPRRPDEHPANRVGTEPGHVELRLEARDLASERVAPGSDIDEAEMLTVAEDHPRAGPEDGTPSLGVRANRGLERIALDRPADRGALAPGDDEPV